MAILVNGTEIPFGNGISVNGNNPTIMCNGNIVWEPTVSDEFKPPSIPTNVSASHNLDRAVMISWDNTNTGTKPIMYSITRDNRIISTYTISSPFLDDNVEPGNHTYTVTAWNEDENGNRYYATSIEVDGLSCMEVNDNVLLSASTDLSSGILLSFTDFGGLPEGLGSIYASEDGINFTEVATDISQSPYFYYTTYSGNVMFYIEYGNILGSKRTLTVSGQISGEPLQPVIYPPQSFNATNNLSDGIVISFSPAQGWPEPDNILAIDNVEYGAVTSGSMIPLNPGIYSLELFGRNSAGDSDSLSAIGTVIQQIQDVSLEVKQGSSLFELEFNFIVNGGYPTAKVALFESINGSQTVIANDIQSPFTYIVTDDLEHTYFVKAYNIVDGQIYSVVNSNYVRIAAEGNPPNYLAPDEPVVSVSTDRFGYVIVEWNKVSAIPEANYLVQEDGSVIDYITALPGQNYFSFRYDINPSIRNYNVIAYNQDPISGDNVYNVSQTVTGCSCEEVIAVFGSATDNLNGGIAISFSDGNGTPDARYDLYYTNDVYLPEDQWQVATNIVSGYFISVSQGTWFFKIRSYNLDINDSTNVLSEAMSQVFQGVALDGVALPSEPTNVSASNNLIGEVEINFTPSTGNPTPDNNLIIDGTDYANNPIQPGDLISLSAGSYSFKMYATNSEGVSPETSEFTGQSCSVPSNIIDFAITNGVPANLGVISFTEADGVPTPQYDLYRQTDDNDILIERDVSNGYEFNPGHYSPEIYYLMARNYVDGILIGESQSNPSELDPADPADNTTINVTADYSIPEYTIEFSADGDDILFDLIKTLNGVEEIVTDITSPYVDTNIAYLDNVTYRIKSYNDFSSDLSNIFSDTVGSVPSKIADLVASDDRELEVEITFTESTGYPAPTHDLYRNDTLIASDISSGYIDSVEPGTYAYYVKACNVVDCTDSNTDEGVSKIESGSVTIDYDSYTWTGNGENTVTISDGIGTFTPPTYTTKIELCIVGAGGSGSADSRTEGQNTNRAYTGGGFAGEIVETVLSVDYDNIYNLSIGLGGASVSTNENNISGKQGGSSIFDSVEAPGGLGGIAYESCTTDVNYAGEGQDRTTCLGTAADGDVVTSSGFDCSLKGFGGQSSGIEPGGSGNSCRDCLSLSAADGGIASGGGGCSVLNAGRFTATSGAGGNGRIIISWS